MNAVPVFCHRPIFTRGRPCRSMLHFRFGPAEPAPCRSRSLLPTSTSDCHFRRPPRCLDRQMDGQTLPQPHVFGTLVKMSVNLPEVHTEEDEMVLQPPYQRSHTGNHPPRKGPDTYQCTHFRTHLPLHRQNTSRSTCHHPLSGTERVRP